MNRDEAKEFVDSKLGDKSYTHSPYQMYREEIYSWLNEFAAQQQVKKLNIDDVSKSFYCNDENIDNAMEEFDYIKCDKQCDKCINVC